MAIEFVAILFLAMQWTAHLLSKCVPGFHVLPRVHMYGLLYSVLALGPGARVGFWD